MLLLLRVNLDQGFQLGTTSRDLLLVTAGWCFRHPWVEARDAAECAEQPPLPRIIQHACCWSPAVDQHGFLLAAFLSCLW